MILDEISLSSPVIRLEKIFKRFYIGTENELEVLHGIDLEIREKEFTSIVGESGSGKSTLMNIIGLLDHQTEGSYSLNGMDVSDMSADNLARMRNQEIAIRLYISERSSPSQRSCGGTDRDNHRWTPGWKHEAGLI